MADGTVETGEVEAQLGRLRASRIGGAALTAVVGVAAAYLVMTWDSVGSPREALMTAGRTDGDIAIAVLALFALHGLRQWRDDGREIRALRLRLASAGGRS